MEIDVKLKPTKENIDWFNSITESSVQKLKEDAESTREVLANTKDPVLANFLGGVLNELEVE